MELAAECMKWYYDQSVQQVPFKVGDKVMLDLKDYQKSHRKFSAKRYGPFVIAEKLSLVTFRLEWPEDLTDIHLVFHASKLSPYKSAEFKGQKYDLPPPVDGLDEYELERIVKSQFQGKGKSRALYYKVRWKGYPPDKDTWEPAKEIVKKAKESVEAFHKAHPQAVRSMSIWTVDDLYKRIHRTDDEIVQDPIHCKCKQFMKNGDRWECLPYTDVRYEQK